MKITSVFGSAQEIPPKHTCEGEDSSPFIGIDEVPQASKSLVLIMQELDAEPTAVIRWHLFNIPPDIKMIKEQEVPEGAMEGLCSNHTFGYEGPCPKYFAGVHRYEFKLYALDTILDAPHTSTFERIEQEMQGHILATAKLVGVATGQKVE